MGPAPTPEGTAHSGHRTVEGVAVGDLLGALEDADCRALLRAAAGEARSVSELSEACDLPLSTTYRKVDTLTEAGLFEERLRLCRSGKHTSEYLLCIEEVTLSLADGGIDVELSDRGESGDSESPGTVPAGAD